MIFIERLDNLLKNKGISRNKLLIDLKLGKNSINDWSKGKSPSADSISKIADYFDVSIDYLYGKSDIKNINTLDPEISELYELTQDLPQERIKAVINIIKAMK